MPRLHITCSLMAAKQTHLPPCALLFTMPSWPSLYPPDSNDLYEALPFYDAGDSLAGVSHALCVRESTAKNKRNRSFLMLFWFHFIWYFISITLSKCLRDANFYFLTPKLQVSGPGMVSVHFPRFVDNIMKNSLPKFAEALRTGMRIKQWYLFSLFLYPLLKPHEGPGDFLAEAVLQMVDLLASRAAIWTVRICPLSPIWSPNTWLCLFIWNVLLIHCFEFVKNWGLAGECKYVMGDEISTTEKIRWLC